jgi:hypothetical protein
MGKPMRSVTLLGISLLRENVYAIRYRVQGEAETLVEQQAATKKEAFEAFQLLSQRENWSLKDSKCLNDFRSGYFDDRDRRIKKLAHAPTNRQKGRRCRDKVFDSPEHRRKIRGRS